MRKALLLLVVLVVMPLVLASPAAQAQGQTRIVTVRNAETEAMIRAVARPLFREAGLDPAAVRVTLLQAWAINAFVTTGNRLFIHTGLIRDPAADPNLHELMGQVQFESGRVRDSLAPFAAAVRLAPQEPLIRAGHARAPHARAPIETGGAAPMRLAVQELESALARDREDATAWRLLATARGRAGDAAGADLALAEEGVLLNDFTTARRLAMRAERRLRAGPARLQARDIPEASQRDNLSPGQRAAEEARRRRERR